MNELNWILLINKIKIPRSQQKLNLKRAEKLK